MSVRQKKLKHASEQIPPRQFMSVPLHIGGRVFLWVLRRWMNSERYALVLRGRSPRPGQRRRDSYGANPKICRRAGLYFEDRWHRALLHQHSDYYAKQVISLQKDNLDLTRRFTAVLAELNELKNNKGGAYAS